MLWQLRKLYAMCCAVGLPCGLPVSVRAKSGQMDVTLAIGVEETNLDKAHQNDQDLVA